MRLQSWLSRCGVARILGFGLLAMSLYAQNDPQHPVEKKAALNPAPLVPASSGKPGVGRELKCAVVDWNSSAPKPVLTVVCPPEEVFAPLRVYLGFSWEQPESIPADLANIVASPKSRVRVEFTQTQAHVLLKVSHPGSKKPKEEWVSFNEVVRIGFSTEP